MNSIWIDDAERVKFDTLKGKIRTDVLVIGGGIAGVLCAHMLNRSGIDTVLVEASRILDGITKNTTAKITFQHGLIYHKLISKCNRRNARMYLDAHRQACDEYRRLCRDIQCDYEIRDSYVYSLDDRRKIENEIAALNMLGVKAEFSQARELPFDVAGAVRVRDQAQYNPLKFLYGIARKLDVYENTKVIELKPGAAVTEHGEILCKKMIIATHFPFLNKHGAYFLKLYQHRSYVLALEGAESLDGMYVDENCTGLSFRTYKNLMLLGGAGHRTGKNGGGYAELERLAKKYYTGAKIAERWATQDCMSLDGISYIGKYSRNTPDLYVATGFNKWGMSTAMLSAIMLTDLVRGKTNEYVPLFSPSRNIIHPQLAVNAYESLVGLLRPTVPRCSHLGCALRYNKQEHTWDCSCHGSRFTERGKLIDNPATRDKKSMPE